MKLALIGIAVATLASGPARADFQINMTDEEYRRAVGEISIDDLAVGDTTHVSLYTLCRVGDVIYADGRAYVSPESKSLSLRREPNRSVSLQFDLSDKYVRIAWHATLASLMMRTCEAEAVPEAMRFTITTINGVSSLSELLKRER